MTVLDASALLAFLQGEPGADVVETSLGAGAVCGAATWSEVAQKVIDVGGDWDLAKALLESYEFGVGAVIAEDGEWAARRWRRGEGLSLGDRLCLALGERLDRDVLTADAAWAMTAVSSRSADLPGDYRMLTRGAIAAAFRASNLISPRG